MVIQMRYGAAIIRSRQDMSPEAGISCDEGRASFKSRRVREIRGQIAGFFPDRILEHQYRPILRGDARPEIPAACILDRVENIPGNPGGCLELATLVAGDKPNA